MSYQLSPCHRFGTLGSADHFEGVDFMRFTASTTCWLTVLDASTLGRRDSPGSELKAAAGVGSENNKGSYFNKVAMATCGSDLCVRDGA